MSPKAGAHPDPTAMQSQDVGPAIATTPPAPGQVVVTIPSGNPEAVYKAFEASRRELSNQLDQLESRRGVLRGNLSSDNPPTGLDKTGIEARIVEIDKRIADIEKQIASADLQVARAAAVPGAVVQHRDPPRQGFPEEVFILSGIFIFVCLLPISLAYARRIWRRSAAAVTSLPQDLMERLNRLDHAVDSIAIEVERIGEGQRFVTRVMTESTAARAVGGAAAVPVDAPPRAEKASIMRGGERGHS